MWGKQVFPMSGWLWLYVAVLVNVFGIWGLSALSKRSANSAAERSGELVRCGAGEFVRCGEHECRPPGARFTCEHWRLRDDLAYPWGTVWRCDCGKGWSVGNGETTLWRTWDRAYKHDAPAALPTGEER